MSKKLTLRNIRRRSQAIKQIDLDAFLEANNDLKSFSKRKVRSFLKKRGLEEIRLGLRRFHRGFAPYSDKTYLENFSDIRYAVEQGKISSPFEHFLNYGYREIISGQREWPEFRPDPLDITRRIIEESALFDREFYLRSYPDVAQENMDPLIHYIQYGSKEGRRPNPSFDPVAYLRKFPELHRLGVDPLIHYILTGLPPHWYEPEHPPAPGNMVFNSLPLAYEHTKVVESLKIAVVIHAFYLDVLEDIVSSIDNIFPRPDLFISVAKDADVDEIRTYLKEKGYEKVTIRPVQNRGRDVAPFLIEFSESLKEYDLCCKIHGKKSLYAGSEQVDWRNHLYHNLLGSREIVDDIVQAFASDEKLGLLFSDNYGMLPYWGYSWLTNKGAASTLIRRLKIDEIRPLLERSYIDYPAGTMFWFRPEALTHILEADWSYEDFPPEPIPNDGTIAHALERLFAYTTRLNGYDFIEVNQRLGRYTRNTTHKNFNQFEAKTLPTARRIVNDNRWVIFDIFDTLVTRTIFDPDNHYRILEKRIDQKFDLSSDFMRIRKETESELRMSKKEGDVSYDDIYNAMAEKGIFSDELLDFAREEDFKTELKILKPKPEVIELFQYAQNQEIEVLLLSDMYLNKMQIAEILEKNGISYDEKNLYVSSDTGLRKDNGTVWKYLIEEKIIDPGKTLMIGDSEVSDAKIPGDFGIKSFHLLSERNSFYESPLGKAFLEKFPSSDPEELVLLGPVINNLFSSPFEMKSRLLDFDLKLSPYEFGYCALAPFFYLYLDNLYEKYQKNNIFFLARDGYFIKELFESYLQSKGVKTEGELHYLEVSRRALLGAVEKSEENLKKMILDLGDYRGMLSDMLYSRMGVPKECLEACGIEDYEIETSKDLGKAYEEMVKHLDAINDYSQGEREAFDLYLRESGFYNAKELVVVDLGYSGTIQNYLHEFSKQQIIGEYFVTTAKVESVEKATNILHGYFGNKIHPHDINENTVYKYSLILEAYLTSDRTQLLRFEKNGDDVKPLYKPGKQNIDVQREITRGISDYLRDLSILPVGFFDHDSDRIKEISLFPFEYLVKNRHIGDEVNSILHLEDDFTGNNKLDIMSILEERGL